MVPDSDEPVAMEDFGHFFIEVPGFFGRKLERVFKTLSGISS